MTYVGHKKIRQELERGLPPVTLFVGPESVGKWELAEHLRRFHKINEADVLRVKVLSMDNARMVVRFAETFPVSKFKLAIVRLRKVSANALNVLLKTLEEAHPAIRFILIAEEPPLATVQSRSAIYEFGLLFDEQVAEILVEAKGFKEDTAEERARLSGGQIFRALAVQDLKETKPLVLTALQAFQKKDTRMLEAVANTWKDDHTELLVVWCNEALSKRWKVFSADDVALTGRTIPLKILMALRAEIRPRLVVRASLVSVLRGLS